MTETNPLKILLADDNEKHLFAMKVILRKTDAEVITVTSGNDALAKVLQNEFALILLDVQMPDMDGFETAKLLRDFDTTRHTPIIFITGLNKEQKFRFEGHEQGAVDYVFKPVDSDVLRSKVNAFLELHRNKEAALASNARFRALLEALPDLTFCVDSEEVVLDCRVPGNWNEMLKSKGDIVGQFIQAVLPQPMADSAVAAIRRVLETGEKQKFESSVTLKGINRNCITRVVPSAPGEVVMVTRWDDAITEASSN